MSVTLCQLFGIDLRNLRMEIGNAGATPSQSNQMRNVELESRYITSHPVPLGLAYVLLVETNPFPKLSLFYRTMLFEYPSVLSRFCFSTSASPTFIRVILLVAKKARFV